MTQPYVSQVEVGNRVASAMDIADALQAAGVDAATVEHLPEAAWQSAALLTGHRTPSDKTRAAVVHALKERERTAGTDPFDGLPNGAW